MASVDSEPAGPRTSCFVELANDEQHAQVVHQACMSKIKLAVVAL
jgi:hypothetical protein